MVKMKGRKSPFQGLPQSSGLNPEHQMMLLEGQPLLSGTALEPSDSNAMILHPHLLTRSQSSAANIFGPPLPSPRSPDYSPTDVNTDTNLADLMQWVELSE